MPDSNPAVYSGRCFCGAVGFQATGAPIAMGYCHCTDCRAWAAAPVNGFTLWTTGSVVVTAGEEHLATYRKRERSHRTFCRRCGGHVLNDHPGDGYTDVFSSVLPDLEFRPALHVYYGETVLHLKDGLPKYADLPAEFGGSGKTLPE